MHLKIKRQQIMVAVAILIASLCILFFIKQYGASNKLPKYLTAPVTRNDIENSVLAVGTLQAFKQVDVGARVSGQLKSLKVELGDSVQKGQLLAEIDPTVPKTKLRSAQIDKEILVAEEKEKSVQLHYAASNYQRQRQLLQQKSTSLQSFEDAKSKWLMLKAHLDSLHARNKKAQADIDIATTELEYTRITAPIAGEVIALVTQEGQTVIAQQQAPVILKLADLKTMTVKVQVPEADVIRIHPGQTVYFTILGNADKHFYGKLRATEAAPQNFLDSKSDSTANSNAPVFYNALFEIPNPDRTLRIGMTAQTHIVQDTAKAALTVPMTALGAKDKNGHYAVRVLLPNNQIQTRQVRTGINNTIIVQVLNGLQEGEQVITEEPLASERDESA